MLSFRQKILIAYFVLFCIFIAAMYPLATQVVRNIVSNAMQDRADEIIAKVQSAPNNDALVRRMKEQKSAIYFRASVISNDHKVLYDTHVKPLLGQHFSQEYVVNHPEVIEAFEKGIGYNEEYSPLLGQKFAYMAKAFDFHGKRYVIRTAFPYDYVAELTNDFEKGVIASATIALLFFSLVTLFIINHLTRPIQQIISAVKPYQEGKTSTIPEVKLKDINPKDEFSRLANTMNSLSVKIKRQIDVLTYERDQKETVLETLAEGIIDVDPNWTIAYVNQMAIKILDRNKQDLIGHHFSVLGEPKCIEILTKCQTERAPVFDTLHLKRDGESLFFDVIAAPKRNTNGAVLVLQDKTAHYKLLEMRKDFIANASHELKTPITIIRGFAETLHDNPTLPQETVYDVTEKIVRNSERMAHLIKDLLILSDVENLPESRLQECDLFELLEKSRKTVLEVHPSAHIAINKPKDETIYIEGDSQLLDLAFTNLIENAAKYSDQPAQITVTLTKDAASAIVEISDKGIGIPKKDLERIFERFYTVDKAHSQKMGGSGLGLSIVQTIVLKHQGRISVVSEVGQGTTFTLIFPMHR